MLVKFVGTGTVVVAGVGPCTEGEAAFEVDDKRGAALVRSPLFEAVGTVTKKKKATPNAGPKTQTDLPKGND